MARQGGLGKGLGALIPAEGGPASGGLQEIPIAAIQTNKFQPRRYFDEEQMAELAESIREVGVLQPVLVRPGPDEGFELIAGERRCRAAKRVGLQTIPAVVRESDDASALEQALVENVQRTDLNPMEEAAAYQQLIEDFGLTHEELAKRVGRKRATVTNTLRLLQLPPSIQKLVQERRIGAGHARALLGTPDRAFQEQLARRAVKEDLSVRDLEESVRARGGEAAGSTGEPSPATKRLRPPGLLELEELLGDHLDTRVKVAMTAKRGKVTIEFSDLEDLERIYRQMTDGAGRGADAEQSG